ncbi:MAG: sugar phosphate isomerase/epimerase, partial [Phycisphaerae bacterium]|nr:sugar phosphate isomerase/epimerase [Phycisphaerae bacterium]
MALTTTRRGFLLRGGVMGIAASLSPFAFARRPEPFRPPIGVCRSPDDGRVLADAGVEYLEVSCQGWLVPGAPDGEFDARRRGLLASPVPARAANGFLPGSLRCTGPDADPEAVLRYAAVAFERAERVGIRTITFGSSGARSVPAGYPPADAELQFAALLARMGPLAARHGVTVCVEPLQRRETNFIHLVLEALRIVRAVKHPNIAITADIFHMLRGDDPPASIRDAAGFVRHTHIAEKRARTAPGHDGDDFTPYLQTLADTGFAGGISIECRWDDVGSEAARAVATLRGQLRGVV